MEVIPSRRSFAAVAGPTPGISKRSSAKGDHTERAGSRVRPDGRAQLFDVETPARIALLEALRAPPALRWTRLRADRAHLERLRRHLFKEAFEHPLSSLRLPPHLFHRRHDPVFQGEQRLHVEKTSYQRLGFPDPPVFVEVLQGVDHKKDANARDPPPHLSQDLLLAAPFLSGFRGLQHDEPQTQRDGTGVDDLDLPVLKLARASAADWCVPLNLLEMWSDKMVSPGWEISR